jgi:hypothetical protein
MGEWRDCIRVSNVEIHLRLGSAQSALPICALEALTADGSMLRYAWRGHMVILPWNMVFAVEVGPLDFTIIIARRTTPPSEFPDEECGDAK